MMYVNSAASSSNASSTSSSSSSTSGNKVDELGENDFLKLLTTQLENQDPMNPMDNTQFISEMAQFTSLKQVSSINTTLTSLSGQQLSNVATALIGKTITALDPSDSTKTISGTVSSVKFDSGVPMLVVGEKEISLGNVISVS